MSFQGMTAQQSLLGAFRMTDFEKQLQEAVTRAIVVAMTSAINQGGQPVIGETAPGRGGLAAGPASQRT